jgi:non-ribosomal peptide synthase protein (TIGR01720 family)
MTGRLDTLSPQEKRALLAQMRSGTVQKPRTDPMSFAQERVWALTQFEPDSPAFNITTPYRLSGPLDVTVLERSLNELVRRHAVLRTTFANVDGQPVQVTAPSLTLRLAVQDMRGIPEAEQETQVEQWIVQEGQQPFDLSHGPLLRVTLLWLAEGEHVLILTTHRIVFDGQCWQVLISELITSCEAFSKGEVPSLPELPLQYADYATWQREWLSGKVLEEQLTYWREQLEGGVRLLRLPTDRPRSADQSRSEIQTFTLPASLSEALRTLSQREGVSLFVTLLTAFQVLLYRYTTQEDFLVFSSVAGRNRPELNKLIGLFANILALRADLSGNPDFRELLEQVRETVTGAYAHQDLPCEQILETLQVERDLSYTSVFQVMFIFWPEPLPPVEWPGMALNRLDIHTKPAEFELHLLITDTRPQMTGMLQYKADLFEAATITRLMGYFQHLLTGIVAAPGRPISDLPILTWELGPEARPSASNEIVQAEQGLVTGPVPILPSQWTFLQTPHLWVNMVEAVALHQPLDPVLLESAVQHLLKHHDALRTRFAYEEGKWRQFIPVSDGCAPFTWVDLAELPVAGHENAVKAALATVQSSLGPLRDALVRVVFFDLGAHRPGYLVLTIHHVISDNASLPILLEDLYTAYQQLAQGEPVRLPPKTTSVKAWAEQLDAYLQSAEFRQQLNSELAPFLQKGSVPLPVDYPQGKSRNTIASIASIQVALSVEETAVLLRELPKVYKVWLMDVLLTALVQAVTQWSGERQMTLRIVDSGRNIEIPGTEGIDLSRTAGCLFVPGMLILERPDTDEPGEALQLVKEQLLRFPLYGVSVGVAQQTAYHRETQCLPSPELRLNYLGQMSLPALPGWSPQTSTAMEDFVANRRHGDVDRNPVLLNCTAVITEGRLTVGWEYSENVHRRATIEQLANNFVEALQRMVRHYQLLRPENGETASVPAREFVAPRTPAEEVLAGIWAKALGLEKVGVHDNFLELGGDSITGLQIVARANQAGFQITPRRLFESQTVAELAAVVDLAPVTQAEQDVVTGPVPLTPAQHWFFEQRLPDPHYFNQALLLELGGGVDPAMLGTALRQLLLHHDGLRLRFEQTESDWQQVNVDLENAAPFTQLDLSALLKMKQDAAVESACAQLHSGLNLTRGPLMRVALFDLGEQRPARLSLIIHRLVADGTSWHILLEDLGTAYQQLGEGKAIHLPKTASFRRWAKQLAERAHMEEVKQESGYWLDESRSQVLPLPVDQAEGANTLSSTQVVLTSLSVEETRALLQEAPKAYRTQVSEVLLTALAQTFAQWTGELTLLLDLEGYGRADMFEDAEGRRVDLSRTVGWLTPIFPVLLDLEGADGLGEAVMSVKEQIRRIPNQGSNYGALRYLRGEAEITNELCTLPQPEVFFSYVGQLDQASSGSAVLGSILEFGMLHRSLRGVRRHLLEIAGSISRGRLQLAWTYSRNLHRHSTIEGLAQSYMETLRALIVHCQSPDAGTYTPSDFAEFEWSEEYFQDIIAEVKKME